MNSSVQFFGHPASKTARKWTLFVWYLIPSVGSKNSQNIPSVGHKRPMMRSAGFTLIELMVVLGLVAILAFIAVPTMRTTIQDNRISTLTNELVTDISLARSEAIRRSLPIGVCASSAGTACDGGTNWAVGRLVFVDQDNNGTYTAGEPVLRIREPLGNNTLTMAAGIPILFDSRGIASNLLALGPQSLALCDDRGTNYRRLITISTTGSVSSAKNPGAC